MPRRRPERAARRNTERARRNAAAKGVELALPDENQPRRVRHRDMLEFLETRQAITAEQRRAGEFLCNDWTAAGRAPHLVSRYDGAPVGSVQGTPNKDVANLDAWRRFHAALDAVGPWLTPVLLHVAIAGQPPGSWADHCGRPRPDGIALLRSALSALHAHYSARRRAA